MDLNRIVFKSIDGLCQVQISADKISADYTEESCPPICGVYYFKDTPPDYLPWSAMTFDVTCLFFRPHKPGT